MPLLKPLLLGALAGLALAGSASARTITVYSTAPAALVESLAEGFTATSGIAVTVLQTVPGQLEARLRYEAANPVADVVIADGRSTALDFSAQGLLLDYASPQAGAVPAGLKAENWVAGAVSAVGIGWNPASGTPRPTDWDDLAGPDFAELISIPDPIHLGATYELIAALVDDARFGWPFFEKLAANKALVPGGNAQALGYVLRGQKAAVLGTVDHVALAEADAGASIEVIFPQSGTAIAPVPLMILNSSAHQDDARAFVDYALSEEGQALAARNHLLPARTDIATDGPGLSDLAVIEAGPDITLSVVHEGFIEIFDFPQT